MEIGHHRFGKDLEMIGLGSHACGVKREIKRLAHLLEEVGEMGLVLWLEAVLFAINQQESLVGDRIANNSDREKEIVLLGHLKGRIFQNKGEGGRFFVKSRVINDTLGRFGNERWNSDEEQQKDGQRDSSVLNITLVGFKIDRLMEGYGAKLVGLLTNAGKEKVVLAGIIELLQLKEVEQFVLNFWEVVANNARRLIVRDGFTKMEHLGKRNHIIKNDNNESRKEVCPEKNSTKSRGEVTKIFNYNGNEKESDKERDGIEQTLYKPTFVVLTDKSIKVG